MFSNEASEVVKEQKGYPYSKHINFNATNRIQDLIGRRPCQVKFFTEETGKDYSSPAPVFLEGLLKPELLGPISRVSYKVGVWWGPGI